MKKMTKTINYKLMKNGFQYQNENLENSCKIKNYSKNNQLLI